MQVARSTTCETCARCPTCNKARTSALTVSLGESGDTFKITHPERWALLQTEKDEYILKPTLSRFATFPIVHDDLWAYYKNSVDSIWTVEEVDLDTDIIHWAEKLNDDERFFVSKVLAFFAASDGIVNENLASRFMKEVQLPEARAFYGIQIAMETIHGETYGLTIDTLIKNLELKAKLFAAIENDPAIKAKAEWAMSWLDSKASFAERLIAFAIVEGIFFSGSFCAIFWLKKRGLMPGLCFSNEVISRDEGMHCEFAALLYSKLEHKVSQELINEMIMEAVEAEIKFITESLPVALIGMNSTLMIQYIKFVADRTLDMLGYQKIYNEINPFDWMEMISLEGKTNFFEKRVAEYAKASHGKRKAKEAAQNKHTKSGGVGAPPVAASKLILDEDF